MRVTRFNPLWVSANTQYPSLVLIYGVRMQISVEMTAVTKKTQFHVALSIALIFLKVIFFKTHGVGTLWYFGPRIAT